MTNRANPISCDLTPTAAAGQVLEWADLQNYATEVEALPTGARMIFPADLHSRVSDLAGREAACCSFLNVDVSVTDGQTVLEVRSENPEARPIIFGLAGLVQ